MLDVYFEELDQIPFLAALCGKQLIVILKEER